MSSEENKLKADFFSEHRGQEEETYNKNEKSKIYGLGEYTGKIKLEGVGQGAEIVTNKNGGKQSKTPMALYLVDPKFLIDWADTYCQRAEDMEDQRYVAIREIAFYMDGLNECWLQSALYCLEPDPIQRLIRIAKVLQYGAERYEPNNWRLIPQESHINHALIHILADIIGDTQDSHIDHALCRLMMAMSTSRSPGFEYNDYVVQTGAIAEVPSDHPDFKPICSYKYECDYKED